MKGNYRTYWSQKKHQFNQDYANLRWLMQENKGIEFLKGRREAGKRRQNMKKHDKIAQLRPVTPEQLLKKRNLITRFNSKLNVATIAQKEKQRLSKNVKTIANKEQQRLTKRYQKLPPGLKRTVAFQPIKPKMLANLESRAEKVKDIQTRIVRLQKRRLRLSTKIQLSNMQTKLKTSNKTINQLQNMQNTLGKLEQLERNTTPWYRRWLRG